MTGLTCRDGQLYHHGHPVDAVPITLALKEFITFLGSDPVMLMGHNIRSFDCPILVNAITACGLEDQLALSVAGFLDTLRLFRATKPGLDSYQQESLYRYMFKEEYEAHNALADVTALQRIVKHALPGPKDVLKHTFHLDYVVAMHQYNQQKEANLKTWRPLIERSVVSETMAKQAAGSGLKVDHLMIAYRNEGAVGVEKLLSDVTSEGKPRVTNRKAILAKIVGYCKELAGMCGCLW